MRDFKKDSSASNVSRFGRDRRERTSDNRSEERRPRSQRDAADSDKPRSERRSFNPNFSRDNRPYGGGSERGERPERSKRGEHKSYGDRKPYGGDRRSFGEGSERSERPERKNFGDRKPYGGDRKSFSGDRKQPFERNRKPYAPRRNDNDAEQSYPKYDPNRQSGEMRLNRFLAQSGLCSRREADEYISAGVVTVNGTVVTELGTKVKPTDEVKFNDSRVQGEKKVYLVLNKPKGYVTSNDDPHADKTVMDLVREGCTERIYPVGRLDKNSVGLLLFTNDGDLTKQLTHPSHKKKKIYQVSLNKPLTRADMDSIAQGITLEDGEIYADEIAYVKEDKTEVGVEIHSGRNRIVRRIFEHLGYSVQKLDRVYYAGLTKKNLKRGQWRFLTPDEVERLKSGRYE
ncbi:MAG: pseudouridine synthase [Rikenellaceae bacterium]